ncbi:MAG: amidase family protein, partial [Pseudomonadota bacterium]
MTIDRRRLLATGSAFGAAAAALGCSRKADAPDATPTAPGEFDAVETALRIRNGDVTALEAVDAAIARAEAAEPKINGVVTETFEAARAAAATASGPLGGVPTFIKDLADVAGVPTRAGSRAFASYVPQAQPPFIDDIETLGLVSLGKSATPEFGLTATTEPLSNGPTRNPWNTDHSTGGSSGGAAALVAAGVVPMAHASDGGGSIRIPASCCGLVGLKASRDRYRAVRDESQTPVRLSIQGVETRTVRDQAAFLASMEASQAILDKGGLTPVGLVSGPSTKRLKIGVFTDGVTTDA